MTRWQPVTVNNFVTLARFHYYDGTGCHRVMAAFVVQCGRPGEDESAPGYTIADELPAPGEYAEGVVAMANTGQPNSGSCQFFINTVHNGYLDFFSPGPSKHPVFGRVTSGMDVVNKIGSARTDAGDRPSTPIQMVKVTIAGA